MKNKTTQNQFIQYISESGFTDPVYLSLLLEQPNIQKDQSLDYKIIIQTGHCLVNTLNGDFITAKKDADELLSTIQCNPNRIMDDTKSFAYGEIGYFYYKIKDYNQSERYKSYSLDIAQSDISKLIAERNLIEILLMDNRAHDSDMIRVAKSLKQKGLIVEYAMTQLKLGNYYSKKYAFDKAEHCFKTGLRIAKKHQIQYPIHAIQNSWGTLYLKQKQYNKAKRIFTKLSQSNQSQYGEIIVLGNLAQIEKVAGKYYEAIGLAKKGLKLAIEKRCFNYTPLFCHFIGEIYKKYLNRTEKALYYYKLGYDTAMEMVDAGITLEGKRLNVVKYYNEFLEKTLNQLKSKTSVSSHFEFALNQPWKHIQSLFQYHLLLVHRDRHQFMEIMFKHLDLKPSTYYSLQRRLKKAGLSVPSIKEPISKEVRKSLDEPLTDYILNHVYQLNWKDANKQFEKDIFQYFFHTYGSNRKQMVTKLKLSYPSICLKMNELKKQQHFNQL